MTPFERDMQALVERHPDATSVTLPDRSTVVSVPNVTLGAGWSKPKVDIKFVAPVGYPFAPPDCFWTDHDLKLSSGNPPQNTGPTPCPDGSQMLWFSWHVAQWDPNRDGLLTYFNVIKARLDRAQ